MDTETGTGWRLRAAATMVVAAALGLAAALPAAAATSTLSQQSDATVQTNGRVSAIVTIGRTTYLGGNFTAVRRADGTGEVARNHLAAVDAVTGELVPTWDPGSDKEVYALAASPDAATVYVGGLFGSLAGGVRKRLGAVDATTGALLPLTANTDQKVFSLYATATTLYVGGTFTTIGGQPRMAAAALDTATGAVSPAWMPAADAAVRAIVPTPDGSALYLGGEFGSINGLTAQRNLVKVTPDTAALLPFRRHPGYPVWSVVATATDVYVGGNGSGGHAGRYTAAGEPGWVTQTDGGVQSVALVDGVLYIGGHFDNVCVGDTAGATTGFHCPTTSAIRHKLVAVDAATGATDAWDPGANSPLGVFALTSSASGAVQVGGDFTAIGHKPGKLAKLPRQGFAQFSASVVPVP